MARPIYLDDADVGRLVSSADLVDCAARAFVAISDGGGTQPARNLMKLVRGGFGLMPGELVDPPVFGVKLVTLFPDAAARGLSSHQGLVILFDGETGSPRLIVEAGHFTALRTAAASVVSARVLARPGPFTLGLLGAGEQAAAHLDLFRAALPPERTLAWARRPEAAEAFVDRHGGALAVAPSVEAVCAEADIVCALTKTATPILLGRFLRTGQHIVAAGSSAADKHEIDGEAVARSAVYLDWRDGAGREAGDIRAAIASGLCGPDVVRGEIGEAMLGRIPGRQSDDEITLFKSLGVAAEDLMLAHLLLQRATGGSPAPA